jgi:hypothetical protein
VLVAVQVVTTLVQVAMTPEQAGTTPAEQAGTTPAEQAGTTPAEQAGTTPAVQAAMDLAQVFTARQMQMDSKLVGMKPQMAFRV